jgi:hypothetical protein
MATGYLIGRLRSVAFYNRKLSAAELQTLNAARALPEGSGGSTPARASGPAARTGVKIGTRPLTATKIARPAKAVVRYAPRYGAGPKTKECDSSGAIFVAKVTTFVNRSTSSAPAARMPTNGYVLSSHGTSRDWLAAIARLGSKMSL